MAVIGGSSPVVTDGLIYALDFGNRKTYASGSSTANSIAYDTNNATVNGTYVFDGKNLTFLASTSNFIRRTGLFNEIKPTGTFTLCFVVNVQTSGPILLQNTAGINFAAQVNTSSFDIGFQNPITGNYYNRRYLTNLNTGSNYIAFRYSSGSSDLFINGLPITSSTANVVIPGIVTSSYSTNILYSEVTGSTYIGAATPYVASFFGPLSQFFIYNKALSSDEIYSNYVPHISSQYQLPVVSLSKPYSLDENALMYVSASNITSASYISAVNTFVTSLKTNNLWNKLSVIYPYIGSTTSSHAINLKEPGVNRLVYSGSWGASSSGSYPISSTAFNSLVNLEYPTLMTSSAHITYMSLDNVNSGSLVGVDNIIGATGGEIYYSGSRTYHVFKSAGTSSFTVYNPSLTEVDVLVVAGGGSGGSRDAGAGGAGGLVYSGSYTVSTTSYNVIIGDGGREDGYSGNAVPGRSGRNSIFNDIIAIGGGAGGQIGQPAGSGGSGGGSSNSGQSGSGTPGQGNDGGRSSFAFTGAGGGGAGQKGQAPAGNEIGGHGGSGSYFSQFAGIGLGSPAGWFAGGGGGGGNSIGGLGGPGGGGNGTEGRPNKNGVANTGGGGGAARNGGTLSGVGGSGIVIVSYSSSLASFTSSFGLYVTSSSVIGNINSSIDTGIAFTDKLGLVSVTRTGSNTLSIHRNIASSVYTAPITASYFNTVYANASNYTNTASRFSPSSVMYLSYGAGMSPNEALMYHNTINKLQYDLGRANLIEGYSAAAAYSVRRLSTYADYAMNIRRDFDDLTFDVGFDESGNLDTGSLLRNMTASLNTPTLPGDYSGLAAAYSLRRVSSSYTGSAIEVRRDWDNATGSIGFDSFGNLDTSSLLSFVGSGNAYVKTWYDQSGNNRHATQSVYSQQPRIVNNGVVDTINGRPSTYWSGWGSGLQQKLTGFTLNFGGANQSYTFFNVFVNGNQYGNTLYEGGVLWWYEYPPGTQNSNLPIGYLYYELGSRTALQLHTVVNSSGSSFAGSYKNSILQASASYTTNTNTISIIGNRAGYDNNWLGHIPELIIYTSDQFTNRSLIEDNINSYYNIFTHSLESGSGYVRTWYDQSGNNKHAITTTNTRQPLLIRSGSIILENNKPSINFTTGVGNTMGFFAGDVVSTNSNYNLFIVKNAKGGNNPWILIGGGSYYNRLGAPELYWNVEGASNRQILAETFLSSNSKYYENNVLLGSGYFYTPRTLTSLQIGYAGSQQYSGSLQEIIIATNDHLPNRSDLSSNINSYFNIY